MTSSLVHQGPRPPSISSTPSHCPRREVFSKHSLRLVWASFILQERERSRWPRAREWGRGPAQEGRAGGWWQGPQGPQGACSEAGSRLHHQTRCHGGIGFQCYKESFLFPGWSSLDPHSCSSPAGSGGEALPSFSPMPLPPRAGKHQQMAGCLPCSSAGPGLPKAQPAPRSLPLPPTVSGLGSPCPACGGHSWLQAPALRKVDPEGCLLCGPRDSDRLSLSPVFSRCLLKWPRSSFVCVA